MSATYVVCGLCGEDSSSSADAIRHKPGCPRLAPPVSETAAWTEQDERTVEHYATRWELRDDILSGITMTTASRICREILRLRAENEREAKNLDDYANEVESELTARVLRSAAKRLRARSRVSDNG